MRQENSKPAIISVDGCGCLVLLMCIGVMGAIALPSVLSMASKAKQSEGKQYVSSLNKGQQAYYAEKNAFSTSIEALGLGLKTETTNYKYSLRVTKQAAFNYGVSKQKKAKSYVGGVFLVPAAPNAPKNAMITSSTILCKADSPGTIEPAEPTYQNGKLMCGKGTTEVTK
ncbi:type IV pilin-like G/H family protein [Lyngbya sp. CCAP 1446/10]|uniref:type IV pilin-like G/H family protein n=1 Tax=Microcoleaceae TaxID=1892252 RepID=UPI002238A5C1|nr:type IV pilin-like G/H family protein [Lyngbya sp. CCAP 1446/10]MCW6051913.1 type IV pilin-like G/H family protein [Lyngbya sp. CCAP 1446/10]